MGNIKRNSGCCYETINYSKGLWNNTTVRGATPHGNTNDTFQYNSFSFSLANQTHNFTVEGSGKVFSWAFKVKTSSIFNACIPWLHFFPPHTHSGFPFVAIFYFCPPTCFPVFSLAHSSSPDRHLLPACCFIRLFTWCPFLPPLPSLLCFIFLGLGICTVYLFVVCFAGPVVASS